MRSNHLPLIALVAVLGCSAPEQAQPGDPCVDISACASGDKLACLAGSCSRIPCATTAACPPDAACVDSFCGPPQCATNSDCTVGHCFEGACLNNLCEDASECEAGEACRGRPPQCGTPPSRCLEDADCPAGRGCVRALGLCGAFCENDEQCPSNSICDDVCRPTCVRDDQCLGTEICRDERCQTIADCTRIQCSAERPFQDPLTCLCVGCVNDFDCVEPGMACSDAQICVHCPIRSTSSESCRAQGLFLSDGCCSECLVNQDCAFGSSLECRRGKCVIRDAAECTNDTECSSPQVCDNGKCREPGSLAPCARQSDCPPGESCFADGRCRQSGTCECEPGSKCVAEPADIIGTCAGCIEHCEELGCGPGQVCIVPEGSLEGYCAARLFSGCP